MAKRTRSPSPLIEAAEAFDDALRAYTQLSEQFVKTPLSSSRQLERANEVLQEIVGCEERLGAAGQDLAAAVGAARDRQEQLARDVLDRLPVLEARNQHLAELLGQFEALGQEAAALNATITTADPREVAATTAGLATRADALAGAARDAAFDELASQAHAMYQRLLAASKKLSRAAPGR
jgi:hypothetical protein